MTLRELNQKFLAIKKVYDYGVSSAQRKIELRHGYNELRGWVDFLEDERKKIYESYKNTKTGIISESVVPFANAEFEKVLDGDITNEIKVPLKFTTDEIVKASELKDENKCLTGSEIALIYDDFVNDE